MRSTVSEPAVPEYIPHVDSSKNIIEESSVENIIENPQQIEVRETTPPEIAGNGAGSVTSALPACGSGTESYSSESDDNNVVINLTDKDVHSEEGEKENIIEANAIQLDENGHPIALISKAEEDTPVILNSPRQVKPSRISSNKSFIECTRSLEYVLKVIFTQLKA